MVLLPLYFLELAKDQTFDFIYLLYEIGINSYQKNQAKFFARLDRLSVKRKKKF
jgi:hypothetical protein